MVYVLKNVLQIIQKRSKWLPVVVIHETAINASEDYIKDYSAGLGDFLRYIKNTEYVFTDSFHGLAFSIIFEKKFVVSAKRGCDPRNKDIRKIELCERLHLEDRILWAESGDPAQNARGRDFPRWQLRTHAGLCQIASCRRNSMGRQEVHEHEAP